VGVDLVNVTAPDALRDRRLDHPEPLDKTSYQPPGAKQRARTPRSILDSSPSKRGDVRVLNKRS
jgi:hypothetical protein